MMMRYLILILLLLAGCSMASAGTEPLNDTIWLTSNQPIQICQLPPGAGDCVAVPPYYCKVIEGETFIILDPSGLPLQSVLYTHVTYQRGDDEYAQVINSTLYNLTTLAPTRCPVFWIFGFLLIWAWKPR